MPQSRFLRAFLRRDQRFYWGALQPLDPVRSISVLIPTWQGAEFLERVLDGLRRQTVAIPWDVHVVDSSSTDGTWELLHDARAEFPVPMHLARIHGAEFDHGDTRNRLAAESEGDLLVFLTQDAIPASQDWLERLAGNFENPAVGAAYCRNVPRPDAQTATRLLCRDDPGYALDRVETTLPPAEEYARLDAHERRLLYNFNDVASAVRRSLWRRFPFPRTWFGEDLLLARAVLEAGYTVVYDAAAAVEHSHDYTPEETLERARVDGRFNAEWLDRICIGSERDVETLCKRYEALDSEAVNELGLDPEAAKDLRRAMGARRRAAFVGLWEGGRSAHRYPHSSATSDRPLNLLYVVHGFPPDTWAGTEVYTLELAQALQARGHSVTILCRTPGTPEDEEWSVREDDFQGVRVLRMTHRLDFVDMRQSYEHPRAERVFRELLDELKPDVVHFQHLLHFSAGLIGVARAQGIATVVTCNDYWALCARVQLIRPDGERCEENQGMGCLVCVKEKNYRRVGSARRVFPALGPGVKLVGAGSKLMRLPSVKAERILRKRRVKLQRWVGAYRDVENRQDYVLGQYAQADLCIGPSRFLRDKHVATDRFDPHRFIYSDYGMRKQDLRPLPKLEREGGRIRFGFVGSLVWYKGVDVLVDAMNRLAGEAAVLDFWGDYRPEDEPFHAELTRRVSADNVRFRGRFSNDKVPEVYREIDVLVVPSVWFENSPITIHEAFLLETPIVTSDIGGMAELVTDGANGLHFRVGDASDLAAKLKRFVDEPELVANLSRAWPPVKDIAENGREFEYRYRALVCMDTRPTAP